MCFFEICVPLKYGLVLEAELAPEAELDSELAPEAEPEPSESMPSESLSLKP